MKFSSCLAIFAKLSLFQVFSSMMSISLLVGQSVQLALLDNYENSLTSLRFPILVFQLLSLALALALAKPRLRDCLNLEFLFSGVVLETH